MNTPEIVRGPGTVWDPSNTWEQKRRRTVASGGLLESEDYPTFVKRLREAGLSDDDIALLVMSELQREITRASRELSRRMTMGELGHEDYQKRAFQLQWDTKKLIDDLVSPDAYRSYQLRHDMWIQMLRHSGEFSEEVIGKYLDERTRQQERLLRVFLKEGAKSENPYEYMVLHGYGLNDWSELEKELGPEATRKLRLATDYRLMTLRGHLQSLKLSDKELDNVGQAALEIEKRQQQLQTALWKPGDKDTRDLQTQLQDLEQEKKMQLTTILGPERYAEYEKRTDYRYTQLKSFAQYNRLSDAQVDHVYRVWKECMDRQAELNKYIQAQTQKFTPETLQQMHTDSAKAINAQTIETLEAYLGADMYQRFRRASGW